MSEEQKQPEQQEQQGQPASGMSIADGVARLAKALEDQNTATARGRTSMMPAVNIAIGLTAGAIGATVATVVINKFFGPQAVMETAAAAIKAVRG